MDACSYRRLPPGRRRLAQGREWPHRARLL